MNRLDDRLHEWADRQTPDPEHMHALSRRITTAARELRIREAVPHTAPWCYMALGALTASILAVAGFYLWVRPSVQRGGKHLAQMAAFSEHRVELGTRLLAEMERVFPDSFQWSCESNGDIGIGVDPSQRGGDSEASGVLVRLMVVARHQGASAWRPAWNADMLLRSEQLAEVATGPDSENKIVLWVYPLGNGKIAMDTKLTLATPTRVDTMVSCVVDEGTPSEIMAATAGGTEYRVLQTARLL